MKMIIAFILLFSGFFKMFSQNPSDSKFVTVNPAVNRMPDGKSLLLNENLSKEFRKVEMVIRKRFAGKEKIITAEGVSAGIDGSLYLLGKIFNKEVLKDVATHMMYNWKPETSDFIVK